MAQATPSRFCATGSPRFYLNRSSGGTPHTLNTEIFLDATTTVWCVLSSSKDIFISNVLLCRSYSDITYNNQPPLSQNLGQVKVANFAGTGSCAPSAPFWSFV